MFGFRKSHEAAAAPAAPAAAAPAADGDLAAKVAYGYSNEGWAALTDAERAEYRLNIVHALYSN